MDAIKLISKKELTPISYGERGFKVISFSIDSNKKCFTEHWHDRIENIRINKGGMDFYRNDNLYKLKTGDIAIVCPKQLHRADALESGVEYDVLMFDVKMLLNGLFLTQKRIKPIIEQQVLFAPYTSESKIKKIVDKLIIESFNTDNTLTCLGLMYSLVDNLYKFCLLENEDILFLYNKLSVVINYIHKNYTEKISSSSVSKRFNYDEAYFCRKFKNATGTTLMKYIKKLRLDMAKRLLEESESSASTVSEACGFSDVTYFSRCFKDEFKLSPTQYANLYRSK